MIYNKEIGCGFDTIIYGMLEFSKDNYVKCFAKKFGFTDVIGYYEEFKSLLNVKTPKELFPFFYNNGQSWCFLSWYDYNKFNKLKHTFTDFLDLLKSDKNIVRDLYTHFLNNEYSIETIPIDKPSKIFEEVLNLELSLELSKQLIKFYYHSDEMLEILITYLQEIYLKICEFHEECILNIKKQ